MSRVITHQIPDNMCFEDWRFLLALGKIADIAIIATMDKGHLEPSMEEDKKNDWFRTTATREANPIDERVEKALRATQYDKCVYKCDNDVVDHQTVNMLFEDDVTITFTMNAFNKGGRFIHIMGTKGELHAEMSDMERPITLYEFETKQTLEIPITAKDGLSNGHGGGDDGIVASLYEYLVGEYKGCSISDIRTSVNNHLIVFAVEESRANGTIVDLDEFVKRLQRT